MLASFKIRKREPMLPLRQQLCYRRSAALARTLRETPRRASLSYQEFQAMIWAHRAWDMQCETDPDGPLAYEPQPVERGPEAYAPDEDIPF